MVLNQELEKLTIQLEAMEGQHRQEREHLDAMDRKVKSMERTVALKDRTIAELDLRIAAQEQTSYEGTLLWKITDFSRRRQDATSGRMTSIYSPAFYTNTRGKDIAIPYLSCKVCAMAFVHAMIIISQEHCYRCRFAYLSFVPCYRLKYRNKKHNSDVECEHDIRSFSLSSVQVKFLLKLSC